MGATLQSLMWRLVQLEAHLKLLPDLLGNHYSRNFTTKGLLTIRYTLWDKAFLCNYSMEAEGN